MQIEPGLPMPITKETYEKMVIPWLKIICYKESGTVVFFPKMDRLRRINQLLADKKIQKKYLPDFKKTVFILIDVDLVNLSDEEKLKEFLLSQVKEKFEGELKTVVKKLSKKYRLVFLIINAEKIFLEKKESYLASLAILQAENPTISVFLFSEIDVTHPLFFPLLTKYTVFCQNLFFIPIYSKKEDANCYFLYLEKKWQIKLKKETKEKIKEQCGHFWLIKEAVRHFRDNKKAKLEEIFNHETMALKLRVIYEALLPSEKEVAKKIILGRPIIEKTEKHSLEFLLKMNFLKKEGKKIKLVSPLFENYLKKNLIDDRLIVNENGSIILNNIIVDNIFSHKEKKVLKLLILKRGKIVSRDRLAKEIWGENYFDFYSDWTIDQTISRLRKKIVKLGVIPSIIKTVKKQGFLLAESLE